MFRWIIAISLVVGAPMGFAQQQQQPTTRPSPVRLPSKDPLTPEQLNDLHVQAVALMRAKDISRGGALLQRIYNQTPVEQRSRALVLNHAIVDLIQRANVGRGVQDLAAWLTAHPGDEMAIDVLGASLNLMAERYNGKRNRAWQAAMKVWERENAQLEQTRPGMHRWGTQWYDENEWAKVQFTLDRAATALRDQSDRVGQVQVELQSAVQERDGLSAAIGGPGSQAYNTGRLRPLPGANGIAAPVPPPPPDQINITSGTDYGLMQMDIQRLDRETLPALRRKLADEQAKLKEMQGSQPRPQWPTRFDPIDPDSAATTKPISADAASTRPVAAATTAPTTAPLAAATQPASNDPLAQAVVLMKRNEMAKAREALDAIWKATPAHRRSRSLVLNRAIVDLGDNRFAIRAVRDVGEYLTAHPEPDEPATNILAAALNNSASDAKVKRGEIWQSAWKEWARRNEELDQSRPGFRRWGADWLTDVQYAGLRERRKALDEAIFQMGRAVDADLRRAGAAQQAMAVQEFIQDAENMGGIRTNSIAQFPSGYFDSESDYVHNVYHFFEANALNNSAQADVKRDVARLQELMVNREVPKWPTRFEPVNPSEGSR